MAHSIPYIIVISLFCICTFVYERTKEEEKRISVNIFAIGLFYFFFAFRGYAYTDWTSYAELLENIEWSDIFNITSEKYTATVHEPGFTILCCICKIVSEEYDYLVIVITTIDTILFLRFLKRWNIENIAFAMMLFFAFDGVLVMFNLLRNQLAIFVFLNALEYLRDRRPVPYFILCTIALSFHLSSILYFPLYFFLHLRFNKWVYLSICCGLIIIYVAKIHLITLLTGIFIDGTLAEKLEFYTEFSSKNSISIINTFEKVSLVALIMIYYDKLSEDSTKGTLFVNSLLLYLFFFYGLSEFKILSERLAILFVYSRWILWILIFKVLNLQNNKQLLGVLLYLYIVLISIGAYTQPIQEYDNLLFGGKSQTERLKIYNKTYEPED